MVNSDPGGPRERPTSALPARRLAALCATVLSGCLGAEPPSPSTVREASEIAIASSSVTYSTRPVDLGTIAALRQAGFFRDAERYKTYFGSLPAPPAGFCSDRVVDTWSGVSNHATCGGPGGSFASLTRVEFSLPISSTEPWQLQIRPDYGLGGAVFLDGVPIAFNPDDMWEGLGQIFLIPRTIQAGGHVLEAYGIENCCDGATFGLYQVPGGSFQTFATIRQLSICGRIDQALGPDPRWQVAGTTWSFTYDSSEHAPPGLHCRAVDGTVFFDGNQQSPAQDDLLRSVMLDPSDPRGENQAACAVLEQSLELCRHHTYTPLLLPGLIHDEMVTRTASCHPGASVDCGPRHQPAFATIFANAKLPAFDQLVDTMPETYCTAQVSGEAGYARSVPRQRPSWECTDEDLPRLNASGQQRPLGFPWPGVGTRVANLATATKNACRILKAVTDCVLPNLGPGKVCPFPPKLNTVSAGQQFSGASDYLSKYCFRVMLLHNEVTRCSAHFWGRAIDLNVNITAAELDTNHDQVPDTRLHYSNAGNIVACVDKKTATPACTNAFRTADADLPPEFVSIMEACGFTWLGRYGAPGGPAAEGGHLGCDPMHFELPPIPEEDCK